LEILYYTGRTVYGFSGAAAGFSQEGENLAVAQIKRA
jgi:hypothetical protein